MNLGESQLSEKLRRKQLRLDQYAMQQEDWSSEEELFCYANPELNKNSKKGDDVTVVIVRGRVISRVKIRVLSVPVRQVSESSSQE